MLDDSNLPARQRPLSQIVDEYDRKVAAVPALVAEFDAAVAAANAGATVGGAYAGDIWGRFSPSLSERNILENLLESAWRHTYEDLQIAKVAPASDRSRFETAIKNPAPFTLDNIRATFGKYLIDPRAQILRGLAEVFSGLDPAFKSHDRMKIGVQGLPKRIILSSVTPSGYGGWGTDRLRDVLCALAALNGFPHPTYAQLSQMLDDAKNGDGRLREIVAPAVPVTSRTGYEREKLGEAMPGIMGGVWLRRFGNGNGHLHFSPETLLTVNKALAEYYGEVLPDCPEAAPKRAKSTEVAKDLQFYRTPAAVADLLVKQAFPREGFRVLEPSCGDGAILDALRRFAIEGRVDFSAQGVEVHPGRAEEARAKRHHVQIANFLQVSPSPVFDLVLMNPPFYGKHYQQHVEHGRKFLKPNGRLLAILPISAVTDHGYITGDLRGWDRWRDLPVGSFSESGTNINTGIATFGAL